MPEVKKKPVHSKLSLLGLTSELAKVGKAIKEIEHVTKRFELNQSVSRAKRCCIERLNALRVTHGTQQIKSDY